MEAILWDMLNADEFVSGYVLPKNPALDRKQESIKLYEQIFRIHQTNREEFQKSFSFYRAHPALLKAVLDSINAKQSSTLFGPLRPKLVDSVLLQKKRIREVQ